MKILFFLLTFALQHNTFSYARHISDAEFNYRGRQTVESTVLYFLPCNELCCSDLPRSILSFQNFYVMQHTKEQTPTAGEIVEKFLTEVHTKDCRKALVEFFMGWVCEDEEKSRLYRQNMCYYFMKIDELLEHIGEVEFNSNQE